MTFVCFDTETNMMKPGSIAQLSAIRSDNGVLRGFNTWYKVSYMDEHACAVHGLTIPMLNKISGGKTFYDQTDDIDALFDGVDTVIGYNLNFDMRFIGAELERCNLALPKMTELDVMPKAKAALGIKGGRSGFKLKDAVAKFGLTAPTEALCRDLFGDYEVSQHDARFDAASTFLLAVGLNLLNEPWSHQVPREIQGTIPAEPVANTSAADELLDL